MKKHQILPKRSQLARAKPWAFVPKLLDQSKIAKKIEF